MTVQFITRADAERLYETLRQATVVHGGPGAPDLAVEVTPTSLTIWGTTVEIKETS